MSFFIFFDLETSESSVLGQILNYSFILCGPDFKPRDELSGLIKISRLQLPAPKAILVNRTDVIQHQECAHDSEIEAMHKIKNFISKHERISRGRLSLVGFNSNNFDIPYLRTSMLRNGVSPFFKAKYKDLLHCARKLFIERADFRAALIEAAKKNSELSLRLETLSQVLALSPGAQAHNSRDDVLLCIELARVFKQRFGLDLESFEAYQDGIAGQIQNRSGTVFQKIEVNYNSPQSEYISQQPFVLLDSDQRSALWINLERFKESPDRNCIQWFPHDRKQLILRQSDPDYSAAWRELAKTALSKFEDLNLKNFFEPSQADIEIDIYRPGPGSLYGELAKAIDFPKAQNRLKLRDPDLKELYLRYRLAHYEWGSQHDQLVEKELLSFALKRFSGDLWLHKFKKESMQSDSHDRENFFASLTERFATIDQSKLNANQQDLGLLNALESFYLESDIVRLAGAQLRLKQPPIAHSANS